MTETEVHVEHGEEHSESIAEEVAEEVKEVLEEVHHAEEQAKAISDVEEKTEELEHHIEGHGHPEFALVSHSHPEHEYSERFALLESRIENIEHGLAEETEEPVVEEIEPTEEHHETPAEEKPRRKHRFGSRR